MNIHLNKGAIYKVQASNVQGARKSQKSIVFIRLERNVKINEKEYNIFIYEEDQKPQAKLLPLETEFSFAWTFPEVTSLLGKKLCFEIENINKKDATHPYKISSVECEYEG